MATADVSTTMIYTHVLNRGRWMPVKRGKVNRLSKIGEVACRVPAAFRARMLAAVRGGYQPTADRESRWAAC